MNTPVERFSFANRKPFIAESGSKPPVPVSSSTPAVGTVLTDGSLVDSLSNPDAEFELCGWFLRMREEDLSLAQRLMDRLPNKEVAHPLYRNILTACRHFISRDKVAGATAVLDYALMHSIDVGGPDHLAQLINDPIGLSADEARLQQDVDIILDYANRRKIRQTLQDRLAELATKPVQEIVMSLSDDANALSSSDNLLRSEPVHISSPMGEVIDDLYDENPKAAAISTGFTDIDAKLNGGIRDQELILIGARPAMGKTALAVGIGRNISLDSSHRRPVLVFSLEMGAKSLASRLLAAEAAVPARLMRSNAVDDPQYHSSIAEVLPRFASPDGTDTYTSSRLWIDDTPGLSLSEIRSRSRAFARRYGRPIIIVDYLQIVGQTVRLNGGGFDNHAQAIGSISQGLKSLAREINTPVIALSQLNRSLESRTNKQPIMSDLRESGSLEQDADIIMFLYRDVVYNPDTEDPNEALAIIAKQREGEIGPVRMHFNNSIVRFENYSFGNAGAGYEDSSASTRAVYSGLSSNDEFVPSHSAPPAVADVDIDIDNEPPF